MLSRAARAPPLCRACRPNPARCRPVLDQLRDLVPERHVLNPRIQRRYGSPGTDRSRGKSRRGENGGAKQEEIEEFLDALLSGRPIPAPIEELDFNPNSGRTTPTRPWGGHTRKEKAPAPLEHVEAANKKGKDGHELSPDEPLSEADRSGSDKDIDGLGDSAESREEEAKGISWGDEEFDRLFGNAAGDRSFRNTLLRNQQLNVDALGRPMDALILKDPNRLRAPKKPIRAIDEEREPAETNWDTLFEKHNASGSTDSEAAMANIEDLRPKDSTVLPEHKIQDLASTLVDGFTRVQLAQYIMKPPQGKPPVEPRFDWLVKQGKWETPTMPDQGRLTPKNLQALRIVQDIWELRAEEHVEDVGRTPIWIRSDVFALITQRFRKELLDQSSNERIIPVEEDRRLDIYSRQSIVSVILDRVDKLLNLKISRDISVYNVPTRFSRPQALEELGRVTGSVVSFTGKRNKLYSFTVWWLADPLRSSTAAARETPTQQIEEPVDVVWRLLTGGPEKVVGVQRLVLPPQASEKGRGHFSPASHYEKRSMSWNDKILPWTRFVFPIGKRSKSPLPNVETVSLPKPSSTDPADCTMGPLTATFGYLLHPRRNRLGHEKAFAPILPHPAALASIPRLAEQTIAQSTSVVVNLAPKPESRSAGGGPLGKGPGVRLRIPVDPDTDLSRLAAPPQGTTLHGVLLSHVTNALMPTESVDVRLARHRHLELDVAQPAVRDFLAACDFDLPAGRLHAPGHIDLSMYARWATNTASPGADDSVVNVPYLLIGVDIHQTVQLKWKDHILRYDSIDAGRHRGQRHELSLRPKHVNLTKRQQEQFLKLVGEIAHGKYFRWAEGLPLEEPGPKSRPLGRDDEEHIPDPEGEGEPHRGGGVGFAQWRSASARARDGRGRTPSRAGPNTSRPGPGGKRGRPHGGGAGSARRRSASGRRRDGPAQGPSQADDTASRKPEKSTLETHPAPDNDPRPAVTPAIGKDLTMPQDHDGDTRTEGKALGEESSNA